MWCVMYIYTVLLLFQMKIVNSSRYFKAYYFSCTLKCHTSKRFVINCFIKLQRKFNKTLILIINFYNTILRSNFYIIYLHVDNVDLLTFVQNIFGGKHILAKLGSHAPTPK